MCESLKGLFTTGVEYMNRDLREEFGLESELVSKTKFIAAYLLMNYKVFIFKHFKSA